MNSSQNQSFTLLEILIVIAIIAILAGTTLVVINPAQLLKKARDSKRVSDLTSLKDSISYAITESNGTLDMDANYSNTCKNQANQTIYLSLIDSTTTCQNLINNGTLPQPPTNWHYHCSTSTSIASKTDGTGWLPINFSQFNSLQLLNLPLDPTNNAQNGLFYAYIYDNTNKTFEIDPVLESNQFRSWGQRDKTITDGGDSFDLYEVGTDLTLSPFNDNGLVLYLPFEENSGTTTKDVSGHNNNGTLTNGPTWTTGKVGYALRFKDLYDYVGVADSQSLNITGTQISVCAWTKINNGADPTDHIVDVVYKDKYILYQNDDWCYEFKVVSNGGNNYSNRYVFPSNNNWHFICGLYDASTTQLWFDGVLKRSRSSATTSIDSSSGTNLRIFNHSNGSGKNSLDIDEVRIYNRALTPEEIKPHYAAGR